MLFRLRVDEVNPNVQEEITNLVSGHEHVLVKHVLPNGNPHFHAYADLPYKSRQALRYHIDKQCKTKSTDRSITECDPTRKDEYIQYLFNTKKGNTWSLISSTLDTTGHQASAQLVAAEFEETRPPKEKKTQGPTVWDMAQETIALATSKLPDEPESEFQIYQTYVEACIDVHHRHKKAFCEFSLARVVQTALSGHKRGRARLVRSVMERIYRQ